MSSFFPLSPPAHSFFIGPTVINNNSPVAGGIQVLQWPEKQSRSHQKKTGSETLPQNVWKRVSLRVISYLFLKEVTFHTPSRFFEHQLVLFHTSCPHTSYLLVFIPIVTRFHTTSYIHTYILVLHTYTASYSLCLSFIPRRLFLISYHRWDRWQSFIL